MEQYYHTFRVVEVSDDAFSESPHAGFCKTGIFTAALSISFSSSSSRRNVANWPSKDLAAANHARTIARSMPPRKEVEFACLVTVNFEDETSASSPRQMLHLTKYWGMPILFLSSVVFSLGHIVVAYRTSCRTRRKLSFRGVDPGSVPSCKIALWLSKVPRSPTPSSGKTFRSDSEIRRKAPGLARYEGELPVRLLADIDSLFITWTKLSTVGRVVAAFERPGCGLISRPCRKDWEENQLPNPYKLDNQAPLNVEGWDEAFHEIGKLLYETVLTPQNAELLLKAVEQLPCPCPSKICSIYSFQTSKYKTTCNIWLCPSST
ncbi:unnamed protein product [Fraxinus pennsylvanica]|uniref:Uncharacterized protein n=1 Tax=Fraxinus pennsylvanica TaxID=56036 RepID=A0AAD1ZCD2_9LAMI|nr:unnamed protein product [Fraxinus pennsylvanica]